ncbi:hypothetical protein MLD38_000477 [Melastoma candidum]|uniref:Uncharacterized protein n=1 Tax=Melastoma candidum TaxID=119954 RepID=A0ACB9SDH8_9MYRT|nr:hypothetical protein MLD38_000477 [Melastoma candidum]
MTLYGVIALFKFWNNSVAQAFADPKVYITHFVHVFFLGFLFFLVSVYICAPYARGTHTGSRNWGLTPFDGGHGREELWGHSSPVNNSKTNNRQTRSIASLSRFILHRREISLVYSFIPVCFVAL